MTVQRVAGTDFFGNQQEIWAFGRNGMGVGRDYVLEEGMKC